MKDSIGLGIVSALEITFSVIAAVIGVPVVPEFCAAMGGFFLWGTLETLEDGE